MSCVYTFKVLVIALTVVGLSLSANIPNFGETFVETVNVQQLTLDVGTTESSADQRVTLCKSNCVQKCLENRKLVKGGDDSQLPIVDASTQRDNVDGKNEKHRPSKEQCLAGCQEACSFYKRLLSGKSVTAEHEKLSDNDNNLGNGHVKTSFVIGESDILVQTTQKSTAATATLSTVSNYISSTSTSQSSTGNVETDSNESNDPVTVSSLSATQTQTDKDMGGVEDSFELRVASLIHQKSLVITELKWNDIGGNPNQAYLVTWELTDGGLKGHLVTDASSVTLSLWPNSLYQVQVEQFKPMLEVDGSQQTDTSALKSLPLLVDTNSFPMGRSSPLFSTSGEEDENYNVEDQLFYHEDEYVQDGNELEGEEEEHVEAHSAHEGIHSMTSLLAICLCSTVIVLVLLSFAAFTWVHLPSWRKVGCCFTSADEPQLLSHEDLSDVLCTSENSTPTKEKSPKFNVPTLFGISKEYKVSGPFTSDETVSVISSTFPLAPSFFHCSLMGDACSKKNNLLLPTGKRIISSEINPGTERIASISESVSEVREP